MALRRSQHGDMGSQELSFPDGCADLLGTSGCTDRNTAGTSDGIFSAEGKLGLIR